MSGEDDGEEGVAAEPEVEPEAEPVAEPEADPLAPPAPPGVAVLEDGEDGEEEDGLLGEVALFFEASSPQAARVSAAAAAISRALVIPVPLRGEGGANSMPPKMTFHPFGHRFESVTVPR